MPKVRNDSNQDALRAIGRAVKNARLEAGLRQWQVAEQVGVSRGTIANIERGSQNTTVAVLWALAYVYGMSLDQLVDEAVREWM